MHKAKPEELSGVIENTILGGSAAQLDSSTNSITALQTQVATTQKNVSQVLVHLDALNNDTISLQTAAQQNLSQILEVVRNDITSLQTRLQIE